MRLLFLLLLVLLTASCGEEEKFCPSPKAMPVLNTKGQEEMLEQQRIAQKEMEEAERKAEEIKERLLRSEQMMK